MKYTNSLLGGLAGALTLNLIHETYRKLDADAPRVDIVGEEALSKIVSKSGCTPPTRNKLYLYTLIADIITNGLYYSLAGVGRNKNLLLKGAALGLGAGVGALVLTPRFGLDPTPITKTSKTKALTVAWYLIGGLVAGYAIQKLSK